MEIQLKKHGIDFSNVGPEVEDEVWSTSVQYGVHTNVIQKAFEGKDVSKMSDAQIITQLQEYKHETVDQYFHRSSADTREGIKKRCVDEEKTLLDLIRKKKPYLN